MTRVTNFGRKRTYIESGIASDHPDEATQHPQNEGKSDKASIAPEVAEVVAPPKKKRKRTKMSKRDGNGTLKPSVIDGVQDNSVSNKTGEIPEVAVESEARVLSKSAKKKKREKERRERTLSASEMRRQKRISDKLAGTICFACREKGHAAKDCPVAKDMAKGEGGDAKSKSIVGICYRCGSTKHSLSRCKKPVDIANPLPFASCFVCNGKGHLASSCPQNKAKGIYPDGGCCKLCGDTSHLAKDCGLRKRDLIDTSAVLGTGGEAGADEDDFHAFKRMNKQLERAEKREEDIRRSLDIKAGLHTGVVKSFGNVPKPSTKKVVYF